MPESDFWKVRIRVCAKGISGCVQKGFRYLRQCLQQRIAIQNLDATQKSTLESLASTYRYDYWNLCEAMIENHQSNAEASSSEGYVDREDVHRQLQLETLRFQRRELNDRLQMRLRMVLNEDQFKFVPGLRPTVSIGKEWNWQ